MLSKEELILLILLESILIVTNISLYIDLMKKDKEEENETKKAKRNKINR